MIKLTDILNEAAGKKEYIIWGVPPGERDEVIAYTKAQSPSEAKKVMDILKNKHGLTKLRLQVLDLSQEFDLNKTFGKTVKEAKEKPVDFNTFIKNVQLSFPQDGWDKEGNTIVNITLRTKAGAPFKYQYKHKGARLIDYAKDNKLRLPIQVKQTIYDKFYLKGK